MGSSRDLSIMFARLGGYEFGTSHYYLDVSHVMYSRIQVNKDNERTYKFFFYL